MQIKRILILTLGVGAGHLRASEAIHQALYDGANDIDVRTIDALEAAEPWFLRLYVSPYWWMLRHAPWAWRNFFGWRQRRHHRSTAPNWFFRRGCREVLKQIQSFRPHLVVATEVGAAELAAIGRREKWFSAPILAAQTDFRTESPWVKPEIDVYCVGSDDAKLQLIGWGVSPNRVLTCGIPVNPAFALHFDRLELLRALGLDPKRPVILVMGGGMGPAPLDEIIRSLEICRQPIQVIAVAGRDRLILKRLEVLRRKVALDLRVFGWVETIPELMGAADLLITKPGGVTTSEALAAGLPMLLTHPIPGVEEEHVRLLVKQGSAVAAQTFEEIALTVSKLLASPERLEILKSRAREVARPDAAYSVAQVARALLEKSTFIDLLATPQPSSGDSAYVM